MAILKIACIIRKNIAMDKEQINEEILLKLKKQIKPRCLG